MEPVDIDAYQYQLEALIKQVFAEEYKKRGEPEHESPLRDFLLKHSQHPRMDELLAALEHNLPRVAGRLIDQMNAEDWTDFLRKVGRSNVKALYKFRRKRRMVQGGRSVQRKWPPSSRMAKS